MASARAQARGGVSGIHIALIVFVALWLTSTVLLVLLYTDRKDFQLTEEQLREEANSTRARLQKVQQDSRAMAEAATGEPGDTPQIVQSKLQEQCARISEDERLSGSVTLSDTSYLAAMTALYDALAGRSEALARAQAHGAELGTRVEALASAKTEEQEGFAAQVVEFARNLEELRKAAESHQKIHNDEIDQFDEKLARLNDRANRDIQEMRERIKRYTTKFDELQDRYSELKDRLGELQITPQELITARQADGRVVTAKPGEEVVYIDLGRDAGLVLGLQFAVYSAISGIPADGQGKARIEVVDMFDSASECRIVEMHGRQPILEGDLVANPVYDRERSLQFMVIGDFDLDGNGRVETDGVGQVESLVESWGGAVAQELSARVDFLVVGVAPPKPFAVGDMTPEAQTRTDAAQKLYDEYTETLQTAQALSIPVLTQSVFMHFLGYVG